MQHFECEVGCAHERGNPQAISGSCTIPAPTVMPRTVNSAVARPCPMPRAVTKILSGPGGIYIRMTVPTNAIQSAESMSFSSYNDWGRLIETMAAG